MPENDLAGRVSDKAVRNPSWRVIAVACALSGVMLTASPAAPPVVPPDVLPPWPRVNLASLYQVDPEWPRRPAGMAWGEMPGIAVDREDHVWLFTREKPPVQVFDAAGKFVRSWGDDLIGKAHCVKIDGQGNIWLADIGRHVVMQCTPEGKLLKVLGTIDKPGADESHLNKPTDMAITPQGEVFVSDGYRNSRIMHYDKNGKFVKEWGRLGTDPGEFSLPHAIALDSKGRLYVADRNNVRIQIFDQEGRFLDEWRDLLVPWGFWISPQDDIWVCGSSPMPWLKENLVLGCPPKDQLIMKLDTTGRVLQLYTFPKGADGQERPGELNWLHGLALDTSGNVYVGDIKGRRAQKFVLQKSMSPAHAGRLSTTK